MNCTLNVCPYGKICYQKKLEILVSGLTGAGSVEREGVAVAEPLAVGISKGRKNTVAFINLLYLYALLSPVIGCNSV